MAAATYRTLHDAGLHIRAEDGRLIVGPAELLDDALREAVRTHKAELLAFLAQAERQTAELLAAAMRASEHHHDGPAARDAMRADCLAMPHHLRADLLAHLRATYPPNSPESHP